MQVVSIRVTDVMDDAMDDMCSCEIVMMICSGGRTFDNVKKVNIVGLTCFLRDDSTPQTMEATTNHLRFTEFGKERSKESRCSDMYPT